MIIRSLEVEGFRCFDGLIKLNDFAPGLNVIYGPNGAGKSTLLRALRHVLVDAHSINGVGVRRAMAPWGLALNPRVRVAIAHGGEEWRIEKQFLSGTFARLEREVQGVFRTEADGMEADDRVRAMLIAEKPTKGIADEHHIGLLQVLWTPPGAQALSPWNPGVSSTLQESFGAALRSPAADRLKELIDERFGEFFSPTGLVRKSSPTVEPQSEILLLREQLPDLQNRWQRTAAIRESLADLRSRIVVQAAQLAARRATLQQGRERQLDISEAKSSELFARQVYEALDARVREWRDDIAAQQRLQQGAEDAQARHSLALAELSAAQALTVEIENLEAQLDAFRQSEIDSREWPDLHRARMLTNECAHLCGQIEALRAPTPDAIGDIRLRQQQLLVMHASVAAAKGKPASGILAVFLPIIFVIWLMIVAFDAGDVSKWVATAILGPMAVALAILVYRANVLTTGLTRETEQFSKQFVALLNGETLATIEERFGLAQSFQQKLESKTDEARPLDLRRVAFEELAKRRPEWAQQPPDLEGIRAASKACKEALDKKQSQYNLPALAGAEAAVRTTLEGCQRQLAELAARLAQHAATGLLETLESKRHDAHLSLMIARTRLEAVETNTPSDLHSLEQTVQGLDAASIADKESAARQEGELAALESQNLYTRLAETEERLAERTTTLEREERCAAAIKLLKSTLEAEQKNLTAEIPGQIAEQATRNWRYIVGPAAHAIRIGESLTPAGLDVPNANAVLDELSGGEAEQVAFATRLALATQLAQKSRQLAVFDDAFLATDPTRAERVLELLAAAAEKLQIIVLTCHPARYRNLPGARHFDLENLKQ